MCTDNAAMVAAAGWWRLRADGPSPLDTGADPNLRLTPAYLNLDERGSHGQTASPRPRSEPRLAIRRRHSEVGVDEPAQG